MLRGVLSTIISLALIFGGCSDEQKAIDPGAMVQAGWNDFRIGQFERAIKSFQSAADAGEKGTYYQQALYGLATVWSLRRPDDDPAKAEQFYKRTIDFDPKSDLAAWSLLAQARMKYLVATDYLTDDAYEPVRKAYQDCIDRFPNHPVAEEAFIYQQLTYVVTLKEPDATIAAAALEHFIQTKPQSPFVSAAYEMLSKCYEVLHQPEKWLNAKINAFKTEESDANNPSQDNARTYWSIATIAEFEAGDFATARRFYQRLIDEYPNDMRMYGCEAALKRMDELEARLRADVLKRGRQ